MDTETLKDMSFREQSDEVRMTRGTRGWQILELYRKEKITQAREKLETIPEDRDFRYTQGFLSGYRSDEEIIEIIDNNAENERTYERMMEEKD